MVLLDNFLEAFDSNSRGALIGAFTRKDAPWTLVAACSDPAFLAQCTHVVHLEQGQIVHVETSQS
jgi:ABC-type sulfate/molybdate transport systems ATPase subunit